MKSRMKYSTVEAAVHEHAQWFTNQNLVDEQKSQPVPVMRPNIVEQLEKRPSEETECTRTATNA